MQLGGQARVEEKLNGKSWDAWWWWDNLGASWRMRQGGDDLSQIVSVGSQTATCAHLTGWCWSAWMVTHQVQPISHSRSLPTPRKEDGGRGFLPQAITGKISNGNIFSSLASSKLICVQEAFQENSMNYKRTPDT